MYSSIAIKIFAVAAGFVSSAAATVAGGIGSSSTLKWTGEVVPGSGNIDLTGDDIQDILSQIQVTNPNYDATVANHNEKSIVVNKADIQNTYCGIFATADKRNFMQLQYDLHKAGGTCTVAARTCLRLSCWNTSGIYICNDNDQEVMIPCVTAADFASHVGGTCCKSSYTVSKGLSGQAFSDEGWNVCVAYANCNHAADRDAPSIFILPGINGECRD